MTALREQHDTDDEKNEQTENFVHAILLRNPETRSASAIINSPPTIIAVAITQNTSLSAIALRIESNEKTRFIATIVSMTRAADCV